MSILIETAMNLAIRAHSGQLRRDGVTPYILHPEAVARLLIRQSEEVQATGWLHDVLEDSDFTVSDMRKLNISDSVINAVNILTRRKGQLYHEYLFDVNRNEIARKVKIADMLHNLSDEPTNKQIEKYLKGLKYLLRE